MALYLDMSKPEAFKYLFSWKHLQAVVAIPAREVTTGGSGSLCHICQDAPSLAALQGQRCLLWAERTLGPAIPALGAVINTP